MPANPETGIDFENDRFAIKTVSTGALINLNATWPRTDGAAIAGANPDRAYYKRVATDRPDADHRYTVTSSWSLVDFSPGVDPADGLPVGEYRQSHVVEKLPVDELKRQVETQFQTELRKAFPAVEDPALLVEAADAITRKQNGAVLTADQEDRLTRVLGLGDAVTQLRARQSEINAAIDADEDYDIEDGWTLSA